MKPTHLLIGAIALTPFSLSAATIDRATLTEVVNSVSIIDRGTRKSSPAKLQQPFEAPNVLRTGADSRAEMVSADQTVTRVGQNTLFSFQQDSREINLDKGSILFQSPGGKGGGTIRTSAASAAVLGTTLIVTATSNGGFKVLLLEGKGRVSGSGGTRTLYAGQLVYALPGGRLSNVFNFQLREQTGASKLVRGFKRPLPSLSKIASAISAQEKDITTGKVKVTGLLASGSPDYAYQINAGRETQFDATKDAIVETTSPFVAAVTSDAIISKPVLDPARLFGPGLQTNEFASPPALVTSRNGTKNAQPLKSAVFPAVFLGNNIGFDTAAVDLSPLQGRDLVQFFATNDLSLNQSVDFSPLSGGQLVISAGGTIRNAPNVTLRASADLLALLAFGNAAPMTDMPQGPQDVRLERSLVLERLNVVNRTGALLIGGGDMELRALQAASPEALSIAHSGNLVIDRASDVPNLSLLEVYRGNGAFPQGYSNLASKNAVHLEGDGNATIRNTSIRAPRITMAERNLTLERVRLNDGTTFNPDAPRSPMPGAAGIRLRADNLLAISGVKFAANDTYMQARTISLADVNFRDGSRVWLESLLGVLANSPNTGAPLVPGKVNFVRNVRYAGSPVSSPTDPVILQNGSPSSGGTPQGPGIVIRPRGR